MKKIGKYIFLVFTVCVLYYFFSVYFSKNGQFIHFYQNNSNSIKLSKESDFFYKDNLTVTIIKDSTNIAQESFDIWVDRNIITEQYGFLPIRFSHEDVKKKVLNINFKEELDKKLKENVKIKFDRHENFMGMYSIMPIYVNNIDAVHVDFYLKNRINKFGSIKIVID